ncbi:MAG: hypothetical protein H7844_11490 [Nitrospirae bacterium YQR-1]
MFEQMLKCQANDEFQIKTDTPYGITQNKTLDSYIIIYVKYSEFFHQNKEIHKVLSNQKRGIPV